MRCDQCNKFVGFEEQEPEVNSLEISDSGTITASVRIVNACDQCSQELKEATLDLEEEVDISGHEGEGHELEIEEAGAERTQRSGYFNRRKGVFVPSGGRYAKTFHQEVAQALREAQAQGQPTVDVVAIATEIADLLGPDDPYLHKDIFVGLVSAVLRRHLRADESRAAKLAELDSLDPSLRVRQILGLPEAEATQQRGCKQCGCIDIVPGCHCECHD